MDNWQVLLLPRMPQSGPGPRTRSYARYRAHQGTIGLFLCLAKANDNRATARVLALAVNGLSGSSAQLYLQGLRRQEGADFLPHFGGSKGASGTLSAPHRTLPG